MDSLQTKKKTAFLGGTENGKEKLLPDKIGDTFMPCL